MKNLALAGCAVLSALALTACATTPTSNPHLTQGKAISAGWSGLKFAADSADALVLSGQLKGAQAAKVSADLKEAQKLMTAADNAYHTNTATDVSSQVAQAAALVAEILTITQTKQ